MKNHPVGAELYHEDRRTDTPRLIVAFRNTANARKSNEAGNTIKRDKFVTNLAISSFPKNNPCNGVSSSAWIPAALFRNVKMKTLAIRF